MSFRPRNPGNLRGMEADHHGSLEIKSRNGWDLGYVKATLTRILSL